MKRGALVPIAAVALAITGLSAAQQSAHPDGRDTLHETGTIPVNGQATPYEIRRLPVSSFPQLPAMVAAELNRRGCLIPQTYEAHAPENVAGASLERPGSHDWAMLCSVHGTVSLLVFFASSAASNDAGVRVLATAPETERLKAHGGAGALGFDWGIDSATPEQVREAQAGTRHGTVRLEHDAVADSLVDEKTVYHYYSGGAWVVVGN